MTTTLELAKVHVDAEDKQDVPATVATLTKDCVYTIDAFGVDLKGREQASQHYAACSRRARRSRSPLMFALEARITELERNWGMIADHGSSRIRVQSAATASCLASF